MATCDMGRERVAAASAYGCSGLCAKPEVPAFTLDKAKLRQQPQRGRVALHDVAVGRDLRFAEGEDELA